MKQEEGFVHYPGRRRFPEDRICEIPIIPNYEVSAHKKCFLLCGDLRKAHTDNAQFSAAPSALIFWVSINPGLTAGAIPVSPLQGLNMAALNA